MVRISILYPNSKGSRFDVSYYVETHMPMSIRLLSAHPGYRGVSVERGIAGVAPESEVTSLQWATFSSTPSKISWPRLRQMRPPSKGTCQTTQTSSPSFNSTKYSFLGSNALSASRSNPSFARISRQWPCKAAQFTRSPEKARPTREFKRQPTPTQHNSHLCHVHHYFEVVVRSPGMGKL